MAEAQRRVLKEHSSSGKLTREEALELKKYVKKNVVDLASWQVEDDDMQEIQNDILELKSKDNRQRGKNIKKRTGSKENARDIYKENMIRYPGLTPGLAPVGMDDEDEDSDRDGYDSDNRYD